MLLSFRRELKGTVIEGMSYNKLVEKLLDFRSMTAVEPLAQGEQSLNIAGIGPSVTSGIAESSDGHQAESAHVVTTAEEAVVGPVQVVQDGAVVVDDTCAPLGEDRASSPSIASNQEGSDSILQQGGPPSGTVAQGTSVGIANTESAKLATALKEGQVAEEFFRETASQLTYYGLSRLHQEVRDVSHCDYSGCPRHERDVPYPRTYRHAVACLHPRQVRERQLCVFFRNNHFSTMFKYEGKLYLLITDLGYARESR